MWSLGKQSFVFIQDEVLNSPPAEEQRLVFNSFVLSSEAVSNFVISTRLGLRGEQRWMYTGCKFRKYIYSLMRAKRRWVSRYIKVKYCCLQSSAGSRGWVEGDRERCQGWGAGSRGCSEPRQRLLPLFNSRSWRFPSAKQKKKNSFCPPPRARGLALYCKPEY